MKSPLSLNTGTVDILLVDLPNEASEIYQSSAVRNLFYYSIGEDAFTFTLPPIMPPDNYKEIGWSDELTEEQAKGLVQKDEFIIKQTFYMDYQNRKKWLTDALESWHSFLSANNITERKYILVKIK